jgi:hypothetical protein
MACQILGPYLPNAELCSAYPTELDIRKLSERAKAARSAQGLVTVQGGVGKLKLTVKEICCKDVESSARESIRKYDLSA